MSTDPLIGHQLAHFRIDHLLGSGGMAQVYYGWDVRLDRPVAIKVIDMRYRGNPAYAQRFVQESRTVAAWRHENIIQIYHADEEDGLYYFVMEYIDGFDLSQWMDNYRSTGELMPAHAVLKVGWAVANALDYAHARGVVHRDVKPSNVLAARDGRIVLADFGLAMDVDQGSFGEVLGSPRYVAPEQARRSSDAIPQSDLYSLGVLLYEMLTGKPPFDDPSPASLALQHLTIPPPPPRSFNPALSAGVEAILLTALSKGAKDRYQTGRELMDALTQALRASVPESERLTRFAPTSKRRPQGVIARQPHPLSSPRKQSVSITALGVMAAAVVIVILLGVLLITSLGGGALSALPLFSRGTQPAAIEGVEGQASPQTFATAGETQSPSILPTSTVATAPSATEQTVSTANIVPLPSPTSASALVPTATVLYPAGYRVVMFYNQHAFYLWNPGERRLSVDQISFEAMDAATGSATQYGFPGSLWAQYYSDLHTNFCDSIAIGGQPTSSPPGECVGFNAVRTPVSTSPQLFWLPREGISQFRVLWDSQEIARCETRLEQCEAFLP